MKTQAVHAEARMIAKEANLPEENYQEVAVELDEENRTVYSALKSYLVNQSPVGEDGIANDYIDYVAIGNCGLKYDRLVGVPIYMGSTAAAILRAKKMNCLFIPS